MKAPRGKISVKDIVATVSTVLLAILFVWWGMHFPEPIPTSARADELPACTPKPSPTPTPPYSGGPPCPTPADCDACAEDPSCTPPAWPAVKGNEPWIIDFSPGPTDGTQLQWRIFPPGWGYVAHPNTSPWPSPQPTPGPGVLLVHGGSWRSGDPFQPGIERAAQVIAQDGFWVFVPTYRLAPCKRIPGQPPHASPTPTPSGNPTPTPNPSGRPPQQTDDVMFAIKAMRANAHCLNQKIGIVAVSSGGNISSYVALYRGTINQTGRPQWNINGDTDRPDCIVTFSSPFDLSDQQPNDITNGYLQYIDGVHNYIGTCDRDVARTASPVYFLTGDIKSHFKPLFMVQAINDVVCPGRQIDDMEAALINAGIGPCQYKRKFITEAGFDDVHGLGLWNATDPDDSTRKVGDAALIFLHQNLD